MIEMEYSKDRIFKILANGKYKGYVYWILNLGTHPTAYVEVPRGHELWFNDYDECPVECPVECHYGLTYSENYLHDCNHGEWTIGWDYAHADDFTGYDLRFSALMPECEIEMMKKRNETLKKWTTKEIFQEVKSVINQLKEME